jgi:flagellar protein FlaG
MGSSIAVAAQQELPQEKRPLPGEKKPQVENIPLPGPLKSPASDIRKTTSDLEHISLAFNRRLKFVIDQESKEIIIKVIDNETDKVIKVLPPEELQRLHSRIRDTIGFLFDRMV